MYFNRKTINFKLYYVTIFLIFLFALSVNKILNIYNEKYDIPLEEIVTINLSEVPQIPWDTTRAATMVNETFSAAIHGSLLPIDETKNNEDIGQNSLLKKYFCIQDTCYAELNKNIKFHNNREVTAYDVEFSLIRNILTNNKKINVINTFLEDIDGIDDFESEKIVLKEINSLMYPTNAVKGIEVIDNYRMIFHLKWGNKLFFQKISNGRLPIVPVEEFDQTFKNWKKYPVGFGKYRMIHSNLKKHEFILEKFVKNENIVKYIKFIFTNEDVGDVKLLLGNLNRGKSINDRRIIFPNIYSNGMFYFNYKTELGVNPNFRKAISLALNREKIAEYAYYNEILPEDQLIPRTSPQNKFRANTPLQEQNIELAKELLNKIPERLWKNKIFHVHSNWINIKDINSLPYIKEMLAQLKQVGINIVLYNTDINYTKFNENDTDVLWWGSFSYITQDPNRSFSFFKSNSYFINESPNNSYYDFLYYKSIQNISNSPKYTKLLSEYFLKNNYAVVVFTQKLSFSYNPRRIASIGNLHNGMFLPVWKIKLRY